MMSCERCGDDVDRLLRHREHGVAVTHRVTRWLCRDCHPTLPSLNAAAESEFERSSESVVTDGGTAAACPDCSSSTVNVHGIHDCVECTWNSH